MTKSGSNSSPTISDLNRELDEILENLALKMGQGDTKRLLVVCAQLRKLREDKSAIRGTRDQISG